MPNSMKQSEATVMKSVKALLKARGILCFRLWSGDQFPTYKGKTRRIMGNPKGTADLLALVKGSAEMIPLFIECKSTTGKQTEEQKVFEYIVKQYGCFYIIVRSAEELEMWINVNI